MKSRKCEKCGNETHQTDSICVLCKIGITGMYVELIELLQKERKLHPQKMKIAKAK